jgi:hypothetical protein
MSDAPLIHMVGSIPLEDAESVFRTLGGRLAGHMTRIPDGETGRRRRWISFINDQLKDHPDLEVDPTQKPFDFAQADGKVVYTVNRLRFRAGANPASIKFNTGYADDAIRNFATFEKLQSEGAILAGVKYQICMATPLAIAYNFISPAAYGPFIDAYRAHLAAEVKRITDTLPSDRISYQWDVCQEVLMWEGYYERPEGYKAQVIDVLSRIGMLVPDDVDLGYHLCYGSPGDAHMVHPTDSANLVEIANGLFAAIRRPIQYLHLPVPVGRNDDAFFAPLAGLNLPAKTQLYLGLIHRNDDAGNDAKLAAGRKFIRVDGIGAECGMGRGDPANFEPMLAAHMRLVGEG